VNGNSYLALVASVIDETRTQIVQRVRPGAIVGPARYFFCFFRFLLFIKKFETVSNSEQI
jgi:hypothetical protein